MMISVNPVKTLGPIHDNIDSTLMMIAGILPVVLTFQRAVWSQKDDRKLENHNFPRSCRRRTQVNWLLNLAVLTVYMCKLTQ